MVRKRVIVFFGILLFLVIALQNTKVFATNYPYRTLNVTLHSALKDYLSNYRKEEYISGLAMSVSLPGEKIRNFYVGKTRFGRKGRRISGRSLFQIGGITQTFVSAIILKLAAEKKMSIYSSTGRWLREFKAWSDIPIRKLLNMTSGIPNYAETQVFYKTEEKQIKTAWTRRQLVNLVYPANKNAPAMKQGYHYAYTNYLLAGLMIHTVTGYSFKYALKHMVIDKLRLRNTFYSDGFYPTNVRKRRVHGYYSNESVMPRLYHRDVTQNNLSWLGTAGAMMSTPEDVTIWTRALFSGKFLPEKQMKQMLQLVSTKTGKHVAKATKDDPMASGLGFLQKYVPGIGNFWYAEAQTLGYRTLVFYAPKSKMIITICTNSAVDKKAGQDHLMPFVEEIYKLLIASRSEH